LAERTGFFRIPFATVMRRARGLPRSTWGTCLCACRRRRGIDRDRLRDHLEQRIYRIAEAQRRRNNRRLPIETRRRDAAAGPNFREQIAQFSVSLDGAPLSVMTPSKRNFTTRQSSTTEAALLTRGFSQLYISLGDTAGDGAIAVRILSQAAGALDLVRPGADGVRRPAVAIRPAFARGRAEAGQGRARTAGGGVG